ncbi:MAG: hypothetical protein EOP52_13945 [Sphingobacteriales bacterium]|nr:MAG: hypothetical protein EOP52_13945 [Sphingobacteriales bacterium]
MGIYISPYSPSDEYSRIELGTDLFTVFYKTQVGPLGFNLDPNGTTIFRQVVEGTIWWREYNGEFENIDDYFFKNNRSLSFNGIFMIPTNSINQEIECEKVLCATQKKNQLLQRYNKPTLEEYPSLFTNIYNKSEHRYVSEKLKKLALVTDIVIGKEDSLGSQFIMKQDSIFMSRLLLSCRRLNVQVHNVNSDAEVPAW